MESKIPCEWYLIRIGDEFAVQYNGDEPDHIFPAELSGTSILRYEFNLNEDEQLMNIIEDLRNKMENESTPSEVNPGTVLTDGLKSQSVPVIIDRTESVVQNTFRMEDNVSPASQEEQLDRITRTENLEYDFLGRTKSQSPSSDSALGYLSHPLTSENLNLVVEELSLFGETIEGLRGKYSDSVGSVNASELSLISSSPDSVTMRSRSPSPPPMIDIIQVSESSNYQNLGTIQDRFARNLSGSYPGLAVYNPIQLRSHSGKIGDIAFFDENGRYMWIRNAFDIEVLPYAHVTE